MKPKYSLVRVRASRRRFIPSILAAALAMALSIKPSQAQSGTWTGGAGTGIWGGTGNWVGGTVASGSGSTASFVGEFTATQNVAVNTARTIGNITLTDTTSTHDVNIVPHTTPFALTLQVASGSPAINVTQADRTLTISNVIAGTQGLTKSGTGTLVMSGTNTLQGAVIVSAGTLRATSVAGSLGAGTLTLTGGTLQLANDTALSYNRNTTVNGNAAITSDRLTAGAGLTHTLGTLSIGANTLTVNRGANATSGMGGVTFGAATLTGASTISPGADSLLTFSSTTGLAANTLTKSGAGQLTLTGVVSGTKALGTTALQINGGTVAVTSNSNTFTGNIAVNGEGSLFQVATGGSYTTVAPWGRVVNSGTAANTKQIFLTNGGGFRLASGSLNVNNTTAANYGAGIIFNIGTGGGVLDVASGATLIIDDGNTTGTGLGAAQIQGAGSITKNGLGILQIDDSTAYAGTITVTAGTLQPASANAFGTASAGTTIESGAQLNVNGITMTNAERLTISGTGLASDPQGALVNRSGTAATWTGPITMSGDSTIGSTSTGGLTLSATATVNTSGSALSLRITGTTGRIFTDGVISGTGSMVLDNSAAAAEYVPRADHTYSGGTTFTSGLVAVDRATTGDPGFVLSGPFGTGTLTLAGGQMRCGTGQNRTVANDITMSADTTFYTAGTEKTLNFTGPVTLSGGNRLITANVGTTVAGTATIFSGPIGDGGNNYGLSKTGTGNLILAGANTYAGGTSVDNGTLVLSGSVPTNTPVNIVPTTASGVSFSLVGGSVNALSNVSALALGSEAGATTLGLELGANTAASDSIVTPAAATTAGTVNLAISALPGFGSASTYDLISAPSGLSGATYTLTSVPGGYTYSINATDSLVQLGVTPAASGDIYWRGNTNNSWSALSGGNTNWASDAAGTTNAQATPGAGNTVRFSAINAASAGGVITTTLDNDYTVRNLIFTSEPNGVNSVTIAGGLTPALVAGTLAIAPVSSTDGIAVGSNAGNVIISAPVILGTNQTWSVDGTGANGSALTVSGAVTGTSSLDIGGLVTISSANGASTYSGPTTVKDGAILQGGSGNSLSANSAVTINTNGILRLNGQSNSIGSLSGTGVVENNSAGTNVTLTAGADGTSTTFSGELRNGSTANLGLTKTGAGTLTLAGANTNTGATTITAGTIRQGVANALTAGTALTVNGTSIFDLNGWDASVSALGGVATGVVTDNSEGSGTGTLSITSAGSSAVNITNGATRTLALRVTNENGGFLLTNGLNTFSGGIVLTNSVAGTRMSPGTITEGAYGTGPITIGEAPTDRAGIYFATGNQTLSNPIIVNTALGTDRVGLRTDGAGITLSGVITANLAPVTFTANTATAGSFFLTNKVTGASGLVLDITSLTASATSFLVTLNNATAEANDYQGDTVVNFNAASGKSATLQLLLPDQIPNGAGKGNVVVNSNGTGIGLLSLAGGDETINGLSGTGNVASTIYDTTLTLGDNNATATHSGAINNTSGILSVTKIGTGIQTLSGSSDFAGALTVNGGTIAFPSSPASSGPLGNSTVVNLNGGAISYTGTAANDLNRPLAIAAGTGTVDVAGSTGVLTIPSITSTGGNLVKTGPGTAVLTGTTSLNAGAASVEVQQGTLRAGFGVDGVASVNVGAAGHLDQNNATIEALVLDDVSGALTLSNGAQLSFELNGATNDSIDTGATGTAVTSGVVTLNLSGTPAVGTYNLLTSTAGGLASANYVIGSAPTGYNYTVTKTDNLVSVTVSNQTPIYWRGGQSLSWNTLGSGSANWTTDGGGLTDALSTPVAADTVIFSATGAPMDNNQILTTLDGAFTVDGLQFTNGPTGVTVVAIGAGTGGALTLSPASATSGIKILSGAGAVTISAPLTVGAAQTWDVDATGSLVVSGDTVFNAAVNKSNAGSLTLAGANSGSGALTLSAGTLNLSNAAALGSGIFTIGAGTTINAPSGALVLSTNNVQNWNGDFTFTGTSDLNLGSGAVTLGNSLTLTASANILAVGGSIGDGGNNRGLTKAGTGTLVLGGSNTYGGLTTVGAGVLRVTNNTALGSTAAGTEQSGTSALELDGTNGALTIGAEALSISGGGITDQGALRNIVGDNTYGGTVTLAAQSRINSDSGTLTLSNPTAVSSVGRTLVIGGAGNTTISGAIDLGLGGVAKDGAGTLTLSGTNTYTGNTSLNVGVMNITGSLTGNGAPNSGSNLLYGVSAGNSVLNISGNITNYYRFQGATNASANAAYIQTAGMVNFTSTQTGNPNHAVAAAGYGYMEITGGTLKAGGRFAVSNGSATTGVMYIGGTGTLDNTTGEWLLMSYSPSTGAAGGRSMMTLAPGGTLDRQGASNLFGLNVDRNNGYAVLNVAGGTVLNSNRAITFGNGTSAGSNTTGILNLSAGTLQIGANFGSGNTGSGSTGNKAYLNFAGGTLKAQAALTAVIPAGSTSQTITNTVYGAIDNAGSANDFAGGLVVDSNSFNVAFTTPLLGAEFSYGVTQDNIPDLSTLPGNTGYIGAPMVQFAAPAAGGTPASGYAVISGGQVTGIVITSPGSYAFDEQPEVTFTGGGGSIPPFSTTQLQTLNAAGGLTKNGAGTLTMSGANTYAGATTVNAGTLLLNGSAATTPTTSGITVNSGGTLAFTSGSASALDLIGKTLNLNGGSLAFDIGVEGINDAINVDTFTLSANSSLALTSIGAVGGTYTLLTSANPIVNTGGFTLSGQTLGRVNLVPTINANTITVTSSLDEGTWNQEGGGDWSVGNSGGPSAPNWNNYKPTVAGDAALFGSAITAPSTVVVDTPHTVSYLRFDNANAYTIGTNGSSNLTLNNGTSVAAITLTSGSHTIAENLALLSNTNLLPASGTTLTVSGVISGAGRGVEVNAPGAVELSAANTYTGTTTVNQGTLTLSGARTGASGAFNVCTLPGLSAVLNITNGTYALAGNAMNIGNSATTAATATVNQSGGAISFTSGNALLIGQNTVGNQGVYNMSGGSITTFASTARGIMLGVNSNPFSGLDSGGGTFNLSDTGTLNMTAASGGGGDAMLQIGRSDSAANNTTNAFNQTGGTANVGILTMGGAASGSSGVNATLNLTGGTFSANQFTVLAAGASNTATINIGGSAIVTLPAFPATRGLGSAATLTLDSSTGSLTPTATSAAYMPANSFVNAYLTANGAKFNVPSGRDITIAQAFQNAVDQVGTLTKDGVGALTLSGANSYTGATTVLAGGLTVGDVNALGTVDAGTTVADGGRVAFNPLATGSTVAENFTVAGNGTASNGVLNVGANKTINLTGDIVLSADSRFTVDGGSAFNFTGINGISGDNKNLTINTDGSVASSITGPLAIGTGSLTKTGGSTLTLGGDNSYSGGTIITGGIVSAITSNNALGSGPVNIDGGLRIAVAAGLDVSNAITVTSTAGAVGRGTIESSGASGIATISGPITILGNPTSGGLLFGAAGTTLHLAGPITAASPFSQRDGRVMYSGGGTGYSSILVTGTTIVGANDGIATTAEVRLGGSGATTFDLNGFNQSVTGVTQFANHAATIGNSSTTADSVLTTTGTSSYAGTIVDTVSGGTRKVGLTVASGQLTLTGESSFTGDITVSGGKLSASAGAVANNALSGLGASSNARTITVGSGATLEFGSGNVFGNHATIDVPSIVVNGGTVTNADLANSVAPNRKVNNALNNLTLNDGTLTATVGNEDSTDIRPGEGYGAWGLNGTVTSTGTSTIDTTAVIGKAGHVLLSSNTADTVFNVASGTLTVASVLQTGDSATVYGLTKSGSGTLVLSAVNIYTANTSVNAGTLEVTGSIAGTASVATTGVLAGTGSVAGATTVATTGVVSPGVNNVGTLSFGSSLTLESGSNYAVGLTGNGVNDKVNVTGTLTAAGTITVTLENGYVPEAGATFDIADAATITGEQATFSLPTLTQGLQWNTDSFATTGQISVETVSADPFSTWATDNGLEGADAAKSADPDGDGVNNLLEFATNSDPTSGNSVARVYGKVHMIGGNRVLTYTVATRAAATFALNGTKQEATKDLVKYTIEGSDDLSTWNTVVVSEVTGDDAASVRSAIEPALPTLETGWEWHTFRTDGDAGTDSSDYIRLNVAEAPAQ